MDNKFVLFLFVLLQVILIGTCATSRCSDSKQQCSVGDKIRVVEQSCSNGYVKCNNTGKCIPRDWLCDIWRDCEDAEDEISCPGSFESFLGYDMDGDGAVSQREVQIVYERMDDEYELKLTHLEIATIFTQADNNKDGKVDLGEFPLLMAIIEMDKQRDNSSKFVYNIYTTTDTDKDGYVDMAEIKTLVKNGLPEKVVHDEFVHYDLDDDELLNYKEFATMIQSVV